MELQLKNAFALVTASTGGIGQAIACSLAEEGATVIVNGRTEKTVDKAIDSIKKKLPKSKLERLVADNSTKVGVGIAAITNTWWLGIVGSVGSRLLSEGGNRKFEVYEKLKDVEENNQVIIERLKLK